MGYTFLPIFAKTKQNSNEYRLENGKKIRRHYL